MLTKKKERLVVIIGIAISLVLVFGIVNMNRKYAKQQEELLSQQAIEAELALMDLEDKDIEKRNIPPIKNSKTDKDIEDNKIGSNNEDVETQAKEEIKEIDGNQVLVKSTPSPNTNKEEAMKKPESQPKPIEPPKLEGDTSNKNNEVDKPNDIVDQNNKPSKPNDKESDPLKDKEKPPTYEKEEPKKDDGVIKDVNGNPINWGPAPNVTETKGSDLLDEGEVAGQGDKF